VPTNAVELAAQLQTHIEIEKFRLPFKSDKICIKSTSKPQNAAEKAGYRSLCLFPPVKTCEKAQSIEVDVIP
jgi:hypothetical protein